MLNMILWLSVIWIDPLICYLIVNEAKTKKNITVGVTIPEDGRRMPAVTERLAAFKREVIMICLLLGVAAVPCFFVRDFNIAFTLWGVWLFLIIILPYIPYVRCNKELKRIKKENNWGAGKNETITVDTALIPSYRWLSPFVFVIPAVLSVIPAMLDHSVIVICMVDAFSVILFWFCYRYLYRNKAERIDNDAELTAVLTQIRRHNWGNVWMACAWCMAALNWVYLLSWDTALMCAIYVVIMIVVIFTAVGIEVHTRVLQERLTKGKSTSVYVDEDDNWICGIFYYNKNDSNVIVNYRIGLNTAINLATAAGKVAASVMAVIILSIPFIMPITNAVFDKPPVISVAADEISAKSGWTKYEIQFDDIKSVKLINKLPDGLVRVNGTGMEDLLTGNFKSDTEKNMKLCLDPTVSPFIAINADNGEYYILGMRERAETEKCYRELEKLGGK